MYASTKKLESGTARHVRCTDRGDQIQSEMSVLALTGGQSEKVSISTTSAQSSVINDEYVTVYSDVDCFFRQGANPTALSNGTDQILPATFLMRVSVTSGNKLAFITAAGTGSVYITPGA